MKYQAPQWGTIRRECIWGARTLTGMITYTSALVRCSSSQFFHIFYFLNISDKKLAENGRWEQQVAGGPLHQGADQTGQGCHIREWTRRRINTKYISRIFVDINMIFVALVYKYVSCNKWSNWLLIFWILKGVVSSYQFRLVLPYRD